MEAVVGLVRALVARMESGRLVDLVSSRHHTPYLTRHRLSAIVTRIRLAAAAFSVLTLIWIPLDAATLERRQWLALAALRIAAVVLFALLATASERDRSRTMVLTMLGSMLAAPMILYGASQLLIDGNALSGLAAINNHLYEALPFIVLAGLSLFPLVAGEGLLLALPIAATVVAIRWGQHGFNGIELFSTLWVLMLALGVYLLACAIQLHYMMALLRRASHDPLTGALTRRSGVEVLELHFRLACDQGTPLAVAFLDVDDFKTINDRFGHEAGDQALRDMAAALHTLLRQADLVIRWGGEEFVVVLVNTPMEGVRTVMARVMGDWLGKRPDGSLVTASIGVAERQADAAGDWSQLIALADERMYAAKTSGKARAVLSGGEVLL